jgi:hypothetical protein
MGLKAFSTSIFASADVSENLAATFYANSSPSAFETTPLPTRSHLFPHLFPLSDNDGHIRRSLYPGEIAMEDLRLVEGSGIVDGVNDYEPLALTHEGGPYRREVVLAGGLENVELEIPIFNGKDALGGVFDRGIVVRDKWP